MLYVDVIKYLHIYLLDKTLEEQQNQGDSYRDHQDEEDSQQIVQTECFKTIAEAALIYDNKDKIKVLIQLSIILIQSFLRLLYSVLVPYVIDHTGF